MIKSKIALVAIMPCCMFLAFAACGGSDFVDDPVVGLDGALPDGTIDGPFGDATGDPDADAQADADAAVDADASIPDAAPDANATNVPNLRSAKTFAVLAGSTVTNAGVGTTIIGNVGVSPGLAVTGLPPGQPVGTVHVGADGVAVQAQADLTTLYNDLAGRPCPPANVLTGQDLAGKTLLPGVYCFGVSAALGVGILTLDANNDPNAFWVFQIASTLDVAGAGTMVNVINGGTACNVFWQVGSSATVLDNALFKGNIVALASITLNTGAVVSPGRALARNAAVTMLNNQVSTALCP